MTRAERSASDTRRCLFRRRRTSTGASRTSRALTRTRGRRTARTEIAAPPTMLELDAAGVVHVGEAGIEIESRARRGSASSRSPSDHELLYSLVGCGREVRGAQRGDVANGLLVHVPRGVVLEKPLYVRIANSVEGGSLFWRLLVVAEPESRFTLIEEYASAVARARGYSNAAVEIVVEQAAKVEYVSVQNLSRETWHFALAPRARRARRRARLGRRRLRLREGQDPDPERPRRPGRDVARDRRLLRRRRRSISTTTPSRSTSRRRRPPTSPSRARCATRRAWSGAG